MRTCLPVAGHDLSQSTTRLHAVVATPVLMCKACVLWPQVRAYIACMDRCWSQAPEERPTFEGVVRDLEAIEQSVVAY
jgi:hypothetical protein